MVSGKSFTKEQKRLIWTLQNGWVMFSLNRRQMDRLSRLGIANAQRSLRNGMYVSCAKLCECCSYKPFMKVMRLMYGATLLYIAWFQPNALPIIIRHTVCYFSMKLSSNPKHHNVLFSMLYEASVIYQDCISHCGCFPSISDEAGNTRQSAVQSAQETEPVAESGRYIEPYAIMLWSLNNCKCLDKDHRRRVTICRLRQYPCTCEYAEFLKEKTRKLVFYMVLQYYLY